MDYLHKMQPILKIHSQRELAVMMDTNLNNISRWARGLRTPPKKFRKMIDDNYRVIFGNTESTNDSNVSQAKMMIHELSIIISFKNPKITPRAKLTLDINLKNLTLHNLLTNNKISEDEYNLIVDYYTNYMSGNK